MLFRVFITAALLLTAWAAQPSDAQTLRQWSYPPGTCPPAATLGDSDIPEQIPEAYHFPARPAGDGQPAVDYMLTVSRRPCGFNLGTSELRVRLSAPEGSVTWRPKLVVLQDGIEHGCTGVNWPDGEINFYPGDCSGARGMKITPPWQVGNCSFLSTNCARSDEEALAWMTRRWSSPFTLGIDALTTTFDPDRAFTIRLRGNWPAGTPDAVYEIPARDVPGNVARIPQDIAGLWWNPAEPGTAVILDRNERGAMFAVWLTYDEAGKSTWFVMTNGTAEDVGEVSGVAYQPRGEPFSQPGSNSAFAAEAVGRFNVSFLDASRAEFRWTVNGRSGMQPLRRFVVQNPRGAQCRSQSNHVQSVRGLIGWGAQVTGQASSVNLCTAHATLLTYDDAGRAMWMFGTLNPNVLRPGVPFSVSPAYATLFRPSGTPYGQPFDAQRFSPGAPAGGWDQTTAGLQITVGDTSRLLTLERFRFEY